MLNITLLPILSDNYTYIIQSNDKVGLVDVGDAAPVIQFLEENNLTPDVIFTTHHHSDHIDGVAAIKEKYNPHHIAPLKDQDRIPLIDQTTQEGDILNFGGETIQVIETAGHTKNHVVFYFEKSKVLFSGDTIFAMGCGRLFEGTSEDMFKSFQKIHALPDETKIYCGHEYTLDNAKFSIHAAPDDAPISARYKEIESLRNAGQPTIPTTLDLEKKTNLFMRAKTSEEFKKYRDLKDNF